MHITSPRGRRFAHDLSRLAAIGCAVMLIVSVFTFAMAGRSPAGAATVVGTATLSGADTTGGSTAPFSMQLPEGAACSGDGQAPGGGYRYHTYMVPESVDPGTIEYGPSTGPIPTATGANFRRALYDATSTQAVVNKPPDLTTARISGLPGFNFAVYPANAAELIPAGTYNVGVACTLGFGDTQVLDKYWNARLTINADPADPRGISWTIPADTGTTTTTAGDTTTTTEGGTTTTTEGGTTTTTGGGTTTTVDGSTTTTGDADVSGGSFSGGTPSAASPVSTAGQLPYTGSSPIPMVAWAVALVVFGRMAMLLGKRPKVISDDAPG